MADLSFAYDAGMQDGKGDNEYMGFTHKYMFAVGVSLLIVPAHLKLISPDNWGSSSSVPALTPPPRSLRCKGLPPPWREIARRQAKARHVKERHLSTSSLS